MYLVLAKIRKVLIRYPCTASQSAHSSIDLFQGYPSSRTNDSDLRMARIFRVMLVYYHTDSSPIINKFRRCISSFFRLMWLSMKEHVLPLFQVTLWLLLM